MKNRIATLLKGVFVGGTMMVPGVSGGSMAMIIGIYDPLISAISNLMKDLWGNLLFLGVFVIGAGAGMLLFAKPLGMMIDRFPRIMMYLFLGAVAGGIPMIVRQSQVKHLGAAQVGCMLMGLMGAVGVALLPEGLFAVCEGWQATLLLLAAGMVAAVALVLPGISVTYLLLVLGLYERILQAIGDMDVLFLLTLGIGVLAGILLTTRTLETAMKRFPQATYLVILGFLLAGMVQAFPGLPVGWEWPLCIALAAAGFVTIHWISQRET